MISLRRDNPPCRASLCVEARRIALPRRETHLYLSRRFATHRFICQFRRAAQLGAPRRNAPHQGAMPRNSTLRFICQYLFAFRLATQRGALPRRASKCVAVQRNSTHRFIGSFLNAASVSAPLRASWCRNDAPRNATVHLSVSVRRCAARRNDTRLNTMRRNSTQRIDSLRRFAPLRAAAYRSAAHRNSTHRLN